MVPAPQLRGFFLFNFFIQATIQPLIYFWQPWFQEISGGEAGLNLGWVFSAFQLSIVAASTLAARISSRPWARGTGFQAALWSVFAAAAIALAGTRSYGTALTAFCVMEITGFMAWLALWQWRAWQRVPGWNAATVLLLSLVTFGAMANAATKGGSIRHSEIHATGEVVAADQTESGSQPAEEPDATASSGSRIPPSLRPSPG